MSNFSPIKAENSMELAKQSQKIIYREYTKCLEIAINALDNITFKSLIFFLYSFNGLEERVDKSNKCPNSFPILDSGI